MGQRWEDGRGRGLGLLPPHCVGHGFMLQGWFCPSEPRWTPSRRRAKGRLAQIGSTPVVFFLPCFWKGGLGEGNDVAQLRIGVGLGGALLPPHGRRRARSLDDGILGEGAPAGLPNLLTSPPRSNTANRPGYKTMTEYRFNEIERVGLRQKPGSVQLTSKAGRQVQKIDVHGT